MEKGYYLSPLGYLKYAYENNVIYALTYCDENAIKNLEKNSKINHALYQYFNGEIKEFPFNFNYENKTDFQKKVIRALQDIPYGMTRTYGEIAAYIGHPKSMRAVGQACKNNPIAIMIPCHRVIGKNGKLTGYLGTKHVSFKEKLLLLEKKYK
jgi:O-6-methylguanine DNA methyltransferase